jgi:hypothetical protein
VVKKTPDDQVAPGFAEALADHDSSLPSPTAAEIPGLESPLLEESSGEPQVAGEADASLGEQYHLLIVGERRDELTVFDDEEAFLEAFAAARQRRDAVTTYAFYGHQLTGNVVQTTRVQLSSADHSVNVSGDVITPITTPEPPSE